MHMRICRASRACVVRLVSADEGQDLAEYGIALGVIGAVGVGLASLFAIDVGTLWTNAQSVIHTFV